MTLGEYDIKNMSLGPANPEKQPAGFWGRSLPVGLGSGIVCALARITPIYPSGVQEGIWVGLGLDFRFG